jgi:hypothetical protein
MAIQKGADRARESTSTITPFHSGYRKQPRFTDGRITFASMAHESAGGYNNPTMIASVRRVPWRDLQDASGRASDIPRILDRVASARGPALSEALDELCQYTLHQGTIYSASPVVFWVLIEIARDAEPVERAALYEVLASFAAAARKALLDGRAIPGHSGGDPADGAAIRAAVLAAEAQFTADLAHTDPGIRAHAADLAAGFPESSPEAAQLVRERYFSEADHRVRRYIVEALDRVRARFADWPEFLATALQREDQTPIRYKLRRAEVICFGPSAQVSSVAELVSTFVRTYDTGDYYLGGESFFEAVHLLPSERELDSMRSALNQASGRGLMLAIAERMLRFIFDDRRTGWGQLAHSTRAPKLDYFGLRGDSPAIPASLTVSQRSVLSSCAEKEALWQFKTNLWPLFGLPDNSAGLRQLMAERT